MKQAICTSPLCSRPGSRLTRGLASSMKTGLLAVCLCLLMPPVFAASQSPDSLRQAVVDFLNTQMESSNEQDIEISVGRIDRRLTLAACQKPPQTFLAPGAKLQGKLTVGLRCNEPKPWTVYIPAQIRIYADVIAAAQPLRRGQEISAADVVSVRQELGRLQSGYFTKTDEVVGMILRQNLAAGHALTPKRLRPPILVHRGEKVTIVAAVGALKVKGKGEALRNAAQGELVSVRNSRSKRIVQGIVMKAGTVQVQM
jgi:flagella basal body P-ring formation protein FlgA